MVIDFKKIRLQLFSTHRVLPYTQFSMWSLIKPAFRNIGRNKRRTIITIITVFIGVCVVLMARGLLNGLQFEFKSALIRKMNGELQIHKKGYQDNLDSTPYALLIPHNEQHTQMLKTNPRIKEIAPRLRVFGLLNHQRTQTTVPVMVCGIDPVQELVVCPRFKSALQAGEMITGNANSATTNTLSPSINDDLSEATGLSQREPVSAIQTLAHPAKSSIRHPILVTPSLMRGMKGKLGDELVLLVEDPNHMQQAIIGTIVGVVDYGMPTAASKMIWMDISTLQDTLSVQGKVTELAIRTDNDDDLEALKATLSTQIPSDEMVETWLDLGGFFRDIMTLQNIVFNVVLAVVFLIVISAIINTSMMTVMERTREIGTLMALGYQRKHIVFLFVCESLMIGFTGAIAGIVVVSAILALLRAHGLVFTFPGQAVPIVLVPYISVWFGLEVLALSVVSALGASIYPAYSASRKKPVEALSAT